MTLYKKIIIGFFALFISCDFINSGGALSKENGSSVDLNTELLQEYAVVLGVSSLALWAINYGVDKIFPSTASILKQQESSVDQRRIQALEKKCAKLETLERKSVEFERLVREAFVVARQDLLSHQRKLAFYQKRVGALERKSAELETLDQQKLFVNQNKAESLGVFLWRIDQNRFRDLESKCAKLEDRFAKLERFISQQKQKNNCLETTPLRRPSSRVRFVTEKNQDVLLEEKTVL